MLLKWGWGRGWSGGHRNSLFLPCMCRGGSGGKRDRQRGCTGLALPLAAASRGCSALILPYSFGAKGAGWCHPGMRLRFTTLSQDQLPTGWGKSPGSLPLPWHTGARRLCCTSQENGPWGGEEGWHELWLLPRSPSQGKEERTCPHGGCQSAGAWYLRSARQMWVSRDRPRPQGSMRYWEVSIRARTPDSGTGCSGSRDWDTSRQPPRGRSERHILCGGETHHIQVSDAASHPFPSPLGTEG